MVAFVLQVVLMHLFASTAQALPASPEYPSSVSSVGRAHSQSDLRRPYARHQDLTDHASTTTTRPNSPSGNTKKLASQFHKFEQPIHREYRGNAGPSYISLDSRAADKVQKPDIYLLSDQNGVPPTPKSTQTTSAAKSPPAASNTSILRPTFSPVRKHCSETWKKSETVHEVRKCSMKHRKD